MKSHFQFRLFYSIGKIITLFKYKSSLFLSYFSTSNTFLFHLIHVHNAIYHFFFNLTFPSIDSNYFVLHYLIHVYVKCFSKLNKQFCLWSDIKYLSIDSVSFFLYPIQFLCLRTHLMTKLFPSVNKYFHLYIKMSEN